MTTRFEHWRKPSRSTPDTNCVEVGRSPNGTIGVRDTKERDSGPILEFAPQEWRRFSRPFAWVGWSSSGQEARQHWVEVGGDGVVGGAAQGGDVGIGEEAAMATRCAL
ncbi:DUF397 domain-containing protein [Actinomadura rugatobispora]|uniref:DUF397 domain-containing protein n=1 Tax=Actinomadura rugatobispora TaxID=1994 RepID=A0ABW1AGK1_9ACTN|nr:hypothetical protein GCM10010200_025230 [Actinomadura rugatobispora]